MMKAKVEIRPARPEDIPTILDFIKQLAGFENSVNKVQATHESLAETLGLETEPSPEEVAINATQYRPGQFAKCVFAYVDNEKAGFAVYYYNYSTVFPHVFDVDRQWKCAPGIFLEDLFVLPSFRSQGVGSSLLAYLAKHALAIGAGRIDWQVLDWNTGARKFYRETCLAKELEEWLNVRVEGKEAMERLSQL
jgi:anoctamin-10